MGTTVIGGMLVATLIAAAFRRHDDRAQPQADAFQRRYNNTLLL
jgi:hypothetical protein